MGTTRATRHRGRRALSSTCYTAALASVLWLVGCDARDERGCDPRARVDRTASSCTEDPWVPACGLRVGYDDAALARELELGRPCNARTDSGLLEITLPVRNAGRHVLRVGLQLAFADASGGSCGDVTTRRILTLAPGAVGVATFVAAKAAATTFSVRAARL